MSVVLAAGGFFLFIHYSHATYQIMARLCTVRSLSAIRAVAARCKLPFALRPGPPLEDVMRTKGIKRERGKEKNVRNKGNTPPRPYAVPADAMKSGVGRNSGVLPAPGSSAPAPCSSSHSRTSSSDTSLTVSPHSAGTLLPTSVGVRKSSTTRPHLSSARRPRIFHRSFPFPVSFRTSAHRIFCWAFYSGHTLKRCSRV